MWDLIVSVPDHCLSFYFPLVKWGRLMALKDLLFRYCVSVTCT